MIGCRSVLGRTAHHDLVTGQLVALDLDAELITGVQLERRAFMHERILARCQRVAADHAR